jgi:hypothetical protein
LKFQEEPEPAPLPVPTKPGRRSSKAKRDSISSLPPGTPDPKTPQEPTPVVPVPEIVSRSGRKIKPKRFADDDIQFGSKSSTSSPSINEEAKAEGPPAAKRSKRVSSVGTAKANAAAAAAAAAAVSAYADYENEK